MAPWRYDPYLWVHLAGLATVPLWIDLCLLGLAVGNPTLPDLELAAIAVLGVLPVLVMQLRRPFYIFSLPGIALRPTALSDDQRRLLSQFRRWRVRLGALLVPIPLVWLLVKLYPLAFLARDITPFDDWGRLGGLAIAGVSFCLANLFLQVPVAVLQVLATPDRRMAAVLPYPTEAIAADFSWLGLSVSQLLPSLVPQHLTPQASQNVEADENVRPKYQGPNLASSVLDVPGEDHAAEDSPAIALEISETPLQQASAPVIEAAVVDSPAAEAEERIDEAEATCAETNGSGHDGLGLRHPEIDDLIDDREDSSSSSALVSHSEPQPVAADAYP